MPWIRTVDLEDRFEKAKQLFLKTRQTLSEEQVNEFYRLSRRSAVIENQLTQTLGTLLSLVNSRKKDHKSLLLAAIPLTLLFYAARHFEFAPEWKSDIMVVVFLIVLMFFELRQQIKISAERVTTKMLLKEWLVLGQSENLALAFATPTEEALQRQILDLDRELNILNYMGFDTRSYSLDPIWKADENDVWNAV